MPQPIIILLSQDSFLLQQELNHLKSKTLEKGTEDFNLDKFIAKEAKPETILNICTTLPMMAQTRMVLVEDIEAIKKEHLPIWEDYFQKPSETTCLILIGTKVDKRLKVWQKANKAGWIKELKPPYPNQLPPWILQQAQRKNLQMTPPATQALGDSLGVNLMAIDLTLEQLKTYIHPRTQIEIQDVEALVASSLSRTVFDFAEKVGERKYPQASQLLAQMTTQGESLVRLLALLTRHFRLLILAQEGLELRLGERDLAQSLGVHPFFVKDYTRQARQISGGKLNQIYQNLLTTDRALKSSPLKSELIMEKFLMAVR